MPSQLPTSFASAAATNGVNEVSASGRNNMRGDGSGDWSRARTNGATQTFRRPSLATTLSHQRENSQPNNPIVTSGVYVPPHLNSSYQSSFVRNNSAVDSRYSKDQLLDIFRAQGESESLYKNASEHLTEGWNPSTSNTTLNGTWSRRDDYKDGSNGPEICWDYEGAIQPMGLNEFSEEEKELFSNSVNSPLKAPVPNPTKEGGLSMAINGRKSSVSQMPNSGIGHAGGLPTIRPLTRRTSDSLTFSNPLTSPTSGSRLPKDEAPLSTPPPSLVRRRTDLRDASFGLNSGDKYTDTNKQESILDASSSFGSFKRTATGPLSASINGPSSAWSTAPQSAGFPSTGAFGNFSLGGGSGQPPTPGEKKMGFGSLRGESRFKGLMSKGSSEDISARNKDKSPVSNMEKLTETKTEFTQDSSVYSRPVRQSTEVNPFDEIDQRVGSAALGGDAQFHIQPHDEIGFSAFGSASDMPSFRDMIQRRDNSQQHTPQGPQYTSIHSHEPMSPTNTNPYQSPEGEKLTSDDIDPDASDALNMHHTTYGSGAAISRPFNTTTFDGTASDRSQTSSAGPSRGFPNLGGLGSLGGIGAGGAWPAAPGAVVTPSRANPGFLSGFGDSIFSPLGDVQSPSYGGNGALSNTSSGHFGNVGTFGRGSKMGSLFPTAMQDQMRGNDLSKPEQGYGDIAQHLPGRTSANTNAPGFGNNIRDIDSPSRQSRGMLDDLFGTLDGRGKGMQGLNSPFPGVDATSGALNQGPSSMTIQSPNPTTSAIGGPSSILTPSSTSVLGRSPDTDSSSGLNSQIPATQQRQMVMPDRMRWIYRDPQGTTQGPWSGLEMHDWYKAGFFSPELQVKKLEDADYEPLAQLIRRIGNSREPFLVPQIGIPHGSATSQTSTNASALGAVPTASPSVQTGSAQPPFANNFPSFGTTLTAEQQNALERRKQEEQYLMARQKEHLAQHQVMMKQMQHMQGVPHGIHPQQLHHHSSAHSLQSQPSYGSITSPTGYQPSPSQAQLQQHGSVPNFFDMQTRALAPGAAPVGIGPDGLHSGRDNEVAGSMERLSLSRAVQAPFGNMPQNFGAQESLSHQQQVAAMLQDRARLQREQEQYDFLQRASNESAHESMARLEHYKQLRERDEDQAQHFQSTNMGSILASRGPESIDEAYSHEHQLDAEYLHDHRGQNLAPKVVPLLAEQGLAMISAKPANPVPVQSPWVAAETGLPMPFPPQQSASPLPAPAAQRSRQNVADTLTTESRSQSQTPSVESPALAPWAKENAESSRGPSLKEIQEAEARQTAQQEEIAVAARRAIVEQERQNQVPAGAPTAGLPSSANWASSASPASPTSAGPSAWTKPLAGKQPVTPSVLAAKKTLAQIQREEESRKNRVAAAAAVNAANSLAGVATLSGGKRYADLAGKVASPVASGAWTTVGAGGKLKAPVGTSSTTSPVPKALSSGVVTSAVAVGKSKPAVTPVRSNTTGAHSTGQSASDELHKWAKGALGKGLNSSINVDDFVRNLLQLPSEPEILSEAIYANSPTLDGRRFAEEFIRRRKLADKGIVPEASNNTSSLAGGTSIESKSSGGWSEVAKKGPANGAKEEPSSAFKLVAAKKKGKR